MKWNLEKRSVKSLKEYPKNPRQLSKEQAEHLQTSIDKFGQCEPIVINTDDTIIGGHQRLRTLKKLKYQEVDVYVPTETLSDKQVEELNIRLNKNVGSFDFDILANSWDIEDLLEWGFEPSELELDIETIEGSEEDEQATTLEPPKDPKTKLGDVYELNGHRLVCGDSTLPEYIEKCLNGSEPILMVTDPPYNYASENKLIASDCTKAMLKLKNSEWDKNFDISIFLKNIESHLPKNLSIYIFTSHHLAPEIWFWMKEFCDFYSWCVWEKPNPMPSLMKRHWTWNTELVCYGTKGKHVFNFPKEGHANPVWKINKTSEKTGHPTEKPISVLNIPIQHSSRKNDIILDPFLGSGTTLIAAEQLGRTCYGIELDPAYCDIIVERWIKYMKKNNREFTIKLNGEAFEWQEDQKQT